MKSSTILHKLTAMSRPLPSAGSRRRPSSSSSSSSSGSYVSCREGSSSSSGSSVEGLREGAQASRTADISSVSLGLQNLDISVTDRRPAEEQMKLEPAQYTQTIEEDVQVLRDYGFIINYPEGLLGMGCFGSVYSGEYGPNIPEMKDREGQPLRNVEPNMPFAVKYVDFIKIRRNSPPFQSREMQFRDVYEIEKKIMTFADHENITPIRMTISMGEPETYTIPGKEVQGHKTPDKNYLLYPRNYLIMDFADLGPIDDFLQSNSEKLRSKDLIKLTQDLVLGLKYLHDHKITHGDVHERNILVFNEDTTLTEDTPVKDVDKSTIVAKWTDFGKGYFAGHSEKLPGLNLTKSIPLNERKEQDCWELYLILDNVWSSRKPDSEDESTKLVSDQFSQFLDDLRDHKDVDQLYDKYQEILYWKR